MVRTDAGSLHCPGLWDPLPPHPDTHPSLWDPPHHTHTPRQRNGMAAADSNIWRNQVQMPKETVIEVQRKANDDKSLDRLAEQARPSQSRPFRKP